MRAVGLPRLGQEVGRIFRFGMVGLSVTLLYAGGYAGLRGLGAVPWAASAIAFTVAVLWQYLAQTFWTFRARLADRARLARFGATIGAGLAVSTALTGLIGPALNLPEAATILIVILWLPVQNYLIFRLWVYRDAVAETAAGGSGL